MLKETLSVIAIIITIGSFMPYLLSILRGQTKPHVFSWIIWSITTLVVFLAQLSDKGGAGAWPIGVSGIITIIVAWLAYRNKGDISITRSDWLFLISALSALPFWYLTADPFWAVLILTTVDMLGFGPTLRKAYHSPHDEQALFYFLFAIRNVIAIFALENYSATTLLFPVATGLGCLVLISVIGYQRRPLASKTDE
jgi:hypothetical protein